MNLKKDLKTINSPLSLINSTKAFEYKLDLNIDERTPQNIKDFAEKKQYGYIAQDFMTIFPDLVGKGTDTTSYLAINYVGLIPVITEAIKELYDIIENLELQVASCCFDTKRGEQENNDLLQNGGANKSNVTGFEQDIVLFQNAPNPFNENTIVKCIIPEKYKNVQLCIYDMQGVQVKCINIAGRNTVEVEILGNTLKSGIYAYLLKADGIVSETKQMILTK